MSKVLNGKAIRVEEFDMEYGYDILYANGKAFRGTKGQDLDPSLKAWWLEKRASSSSRTSPAEGRLPALWG